MFGVFTLLDNQSPSCTDISVDLELLLLRPFPHDIYWILEESASNLLSQKLFHDKN